MEFFVGQSLFWLYEIPNGWGQSFPIPCKVVKVGKKIIVEVQTRSGPALKCVGANKLISEADGLQNGASK